MDNWEILNRALEQSRKESTERQEGGENFFPLPRLKDIGGTGCALNPLTAIVNNDPSGMTKPHRFEGGDAE